MAFNGRSGPYRKGMRDTGYERLANKKSCSAMCSVCKSLRDAMLMAQPGVVVPVNVAVVPIVAIVLVVPLVSLDVLLCATCATRCGLLS